MSGMRPKPKSLLEEPPPLPPLERPVPPFKVLHAASENTRMMQEALDELLVRKRWVFAAMALAFCISTVWYWKDPPLYESTVSFYAMRSPVRDKDSPVRLTVHTDPQELKLIATSSPMFDHLISVFDLRAHYGVPAGSPEEHTVLHSILQKRVVVDMRETDMVVVRVQDHDRALAAAMANAIFETTRTMVRADQKADLERQLRILKHVIDSTNRFATDRGAELVRLADELRSPSIAQNGASGLTRTLLSTANDVAAANQGLMHQRQSYANLLAMVSEPDNDPIRLRTQAMEDLGAHPIRSMILGILAITLITGIASTLILLLIIENWFAPVPIIQRR